LAIIHEIVRRHHATPSCGPSGEGPNAFYSDQRADRRCDWCDLLLRHRQVRSRSPPRKPAQAARGADLPVADPAAAASIVGAGVLIASAAGGAVAGAT